MPLSSILHLPTLLFLFSFIFTSAAFAANENALPINDNKAPTAHVEHLIGQGWALHSDESRTRLYVGLELQQGDSIQTAARSIALLRFSDGSSLTVKQSSQITIRTYRWNKDQSDGQSIAKLRPKSTGYVR